MSEEQHQPYYSTRIRLADITSPKDFVGLKERTIEITIGNTQNPIVLKNPKDVADIESKSMQEMLLQAFTDTDEVAKIRGFKFLDQMEKSQ